MFQFFGLLDLIHYGTFNQLCERLLNSSRNIRDASERYVKEGTLDISTTLNESRRRRCLLIDEVDVFFDDSFYGNIYTPFAILQGPKISSLVKKVWELHKSERGCTYKAVQKTDEYKTVVSQFEGRGEIVEERIKSMVYDVKKFESHDWIVADGKIGYKENDGISFNVSYGFKTVFAWFKECEAGNVTATARDKNIKMAFFGTRC